MNVFETSIISISKLTMFIFAGFASVPVLVAADGLAISISISGSPKQQLNVNEVFQVVLTNDSQSDIKIRHPNSVGGFYALSFECSNLSTHTSVVTQKREIDEIKLLNAFPEERLVDIDPVVIAPGTSYTIEVKWIRYLLEGNEWTNVPVPNTEATYSLVAKYQAARREDDDPSLWNGTIESEAVRVQINSNRTKTPQEFLANNNVELALNMMKREPDWINHKDHNSLTPLHIAAKKSQLGVIQWLLENDANVNESTHYGATALHLASDPNVVKLLLKHSPFLNVHTENDGETPLQSATLRLYQTPYGKYDNSIWRSIVDQLLDAGAFYDLASAIYLDDLPRVKVIFEHGDRSDQECRESPLRLAASLGRLEICEYLIKERHMDVDQFAEGSGIPIIVAALRYPKVVRLLIDSGANLTKRITLQAGQTGLGHVEDEATVLHYAAYDGTPDTIKLLIDSGIDIFATTSSDSIVAQFNETALEVACHYSKADLVEAIVDHPKFIASDVNLRQRTLDRCLVCESYSNDDEADRPRVLSLLLDHGADPNETDNLGYTAIQIAASKIDFDRVSDTNDLRQLAEAIVKHGGELDLCTAVAIGDESAVAHILETDPQAANSRTLDGYPALHLAVQSGDKKLVRTLLVAGADANIVNESYEHGSSGETALHRAAELGLVEIARALLNSHADVNARDESRNTPLHHATASANIPMIKLLLERGAEIYAMDDSGETPFKQYEDDDSEESRGVMRVLRDRLPK